MVIREGFEKKINNEGRNETETDEVESKRRQKRQKANIVDWLRQSNKTEKTLFESGQICDQHQGGVLQQRDRGGDILFFTSTPIFIPSKFKNTRA